MPNPYSSKSSEHFWRSAIADRSLDEIAAVPAKRFAIADGMRIATAGSCFAQNVGKHLVGNDSIHLIIEEQVGPDEPLFSALYGNIYTIRQLLQLFDRAHGNFSPRDKAWVRKDGRYVDPFRPFIPTHAYATPENVEEARARHLQAVQRVFSGCDVFIFTLGLTETWISEQDGAVFPIAPGVVSEFCTSSQYQFCNLSYDDCLADLEAFFARFRKVNPDPRVILTVSPVPLSATYTNNHVAIATCHRRGDHGCDRQHAHRDRNHHRGRLAIAPSEQQVDHDPAEPDPEEHTRDRAGQRSEWGGDQPEDRPAAFVREKCDETEGETEPERKSTDRQIDRRPDCEPACGEGADRAEVARRGARRTPPTR